MNRSRLFSLACLASCHIGTPGQTATSASDAGSATNSTFDVTNGSTTFGGSGPLTGSTAGTSGTTEDSDFPTCATRVGSPYHTMSWPNPGGEWTQSLAVSPEGVIYALFFTRYSCEDKMPVLDFGQPVPGVPQMSNYSASGAFVRYGSTFTPMVSHFFGGVGPRVTRDIALDSHGRIYIVGSYTNKIEIPVVLGNPIEIVQTPDMESEANKGFIAVFDDESNAHVIHVLLKDEQGASDVVVWSVGTSRDGKRFAVGGEYFGAPPKLDTATACPTVKADLDEHPDSNAFVAVFEANGTHLWTQCIAPPSDASSGQAQAVPVQLAFTDDGGVVAVGVFDGLREFGPPGGSQVHKASGLPDGFVAAWESDGTATWHVICTSEQRDSVEDVVIGSDGRVVIVGAVGDASRCSSPRPDGNSEFSRGFVGALRGGSPVTWIFDKPIKSTSSTTGQSSVLHSVAADACGDIAASGTARGPVVWEDDAAPFEDPVPGNTENDVIVVKLDHEANPLWSHRVGAGGFDGSTVVAADAAGSVYVGGYIGRGDANGDTSDDSISPASGVTWPAPEDCPPDTPSDAIILHYSP